MPGIVADGHSFDHHARSASRSDYCPGFADLHVLPIQLYLKTIDPHLMFMRIFAGSDPASRQLHRENVEKVTHQGYGLHEHESG